MSAPPAAPPSPSTLAGLWRGLAGWVLRCLGQATLDDPGTELLRIVRFGLVGISATIAHLGTWTLLVELWALNPLLASTLGVCVSFWISYFGHQAFSFAVERDHRAYLVRFLIGSAIAFALNLSIVSINTYLLHWPYQVAQGVLAVVIPATSYLLSRFWIFRSGLARQRDS
jgi:putative flippase GtrA